MKHLKKMNENFFKKAVNAVGKMISPDPIDVGNLDDTEKKYTERQLFDLTDEAFRLGYTVGSPNSTIQSEWLSWNYDENLNYSYILNQ